MDKKNTIIGVLLLIAAFYFMYDSTSKESAAARHAAEIAAAQEAAAAPRQGESPKTATLTSPYAPEENIKEEFLTLRNDAIALHLTNKGGAISNVELLGYEQSQDSDKPFQFNAVKDAIPALGLAFFDPTSDLPQPYIKNFALVAKTDNSATYKYIENGKFEIVRTFSIPQGNSKDAKAYTVQTKTEIKNISNSPLDLREVYLCLGAVPPTASDVYGSNLAFMLFDGDSSHFSRSSSFIDSSGFLGIGSSRAKPYEKINEYPISWGAVKNQFFAAVFTPAKISSNGGVAIPIRLDGNIDNKYMRNAITGFMGFGIETLKPQQSWELDGSYYVGPKELDRLFSLGKHQEEVMNYGWFGFVSRPLSRLMNWIHSWVSIVSPDWGWGWSIIILTLIVRLLMWPLTSIQIKSAQRMSKFQAPLKEIREKYKNDPKRVQQETMKLYSEYGINPLAGCLPVLIQIPIFIGLYYMLQTSCEIRFAHFLWISDLSLPDTLEWCPTIFGFPLHILPLVNAGVTFLQMHLTPTPTTDKSQKIMFSLMPVIMLLFFYTFPSGLVLYWLVQSLLGIIQAIIIRKGADKVVLKKRDKPGFMQRLQEAMEQAAAVQQSRGEDYQKLPFKEKLRIAREDAAKAKKKMKENRLNGTMYEKRKKNSGGRSTPPKR